MTGNCGNPARARGLAHGVRTDGVRSGRSRRLGKRGFLCGRKLGIGLEKIVGVHKTRVKRDKLSVGFGNVVAGDGGLVVGAKPTRIEDLGSIPRGVGWKVKEVGDGGDDCSDLVGTGEARGKNVVVTCAGTAGFRQGRAGKICKCKKCINLHNFKFSQDA